MGYNEHDHQMIQGRRESEYETLKGRKTGSNSRGSSRRSAILGLAVLAGFFGLIWLYFTY
ncbi:hypothetical protein JSY36_09605 [Bacillus sp. H-16]|uniref:hypothetical protein n=1 Tax=Alteribacter salitolerans TaxID=2912333 RepID=UPI0019630099|nr:hypothetical protein [Alteribacter salitolerans]MBM7096011.1 hypothetical protein [Alteribacter salitolerans]